MLDKQQRKILLNKEERIIGEFLIASLFLFALFEHAQNTRAFMRRKGIFECRVIFTHSSNFGVQA